MQSSKPASARRIAWFLGLVLARSPGVANAQARPEESPSTGPSVRPARTLQTREGYQHWFGGAYAGRGLRLNNPYRLRSVLGDDAESWSLGATYLDLHLARTFSEPDTLEHGVACHFSIATDGVRQEVVTPSYLLLQRFDGRFLGYARAGIPIVLEPDASLGLEAGVGAAYFLSASLGIGMELDLSLFYGAATIEKPITVIPMLSLAVGLVFDWEQLP